MEYIDLDEFLFKVVDDMDAYFKDAFNEDFEVDFDALGDAIDGELPYEQFKELIQAERVDKLDKKHIFSYGAVLFGLIQNIKDKQEDRVYDALELAYVYIKDNVKLFLVLYNVFAESDEYRMHVFFKLCEVLESTGAMHTILNNLKSINKISERWNISTKDRINLYKRVCDMLIAQDCTYDAYQLMLRTIELLADDSQAIKDNEAFISKTITIGLQHPKIVQFDILSDQPAVKESVKVNSKNQLYQLLEIFTNGHLADYTKWENANQDFIKSSSIDSTMCKNKMMYLNVCIAANKDNVITYDKLSELVGISRDDIEDWIIDAIVNNIIDARLDQDKECIVINSYTKRNMNKMDEWKDLKSKIDSTRGKFGKVLQLIRPQ
jgi:hypothetical protein